MMRILKGALALLCALIVLPSNLAASSALLPQEEGGGGTAGGGEGGEPAAGEKESASDTWFALINGDIHTGTGAVLRGATLLARNGRIQSIGYDLTVPEQAKVLDAKGMRVYPGFVAIASQGLLGNTGGEFQDTIDPFTQRMVLALASGITTAAQGTAAVKLRRGEVADVVTRDRYLVSLSYTTNNPSGRRSLQEKLEATAKYLREYREWEEKKKEDKDLKEPSKRGVDTSVLSVLKGEALARFNADSRGDLLEIARLAQKYNFRPVIDGCREGWTVAAELGRAGAYAVITPRSRSDKSEELVREGGSSIENAAILHRAGVQVAIIPSARGVDLGGIAGRDIMHLQIEAGFAVRGGLPEKAAFEAITLVPARILGVDHRVGVLEVGKDADLIVTDGDPLHYETFVQYAVVGGKQVYDKQEELFFAHIRPRPSAELAPEKKVDKGQEPEPKPEPEPEPAPEPTPEEKPTPPGEGGG